MEFKMERVEVKPIPEMVTTPTEDFLKSISDHQFVHYLSRSGITSTKPDILDWAPKGWSPEQLAIALAKSEKPTSTVSRFVLALHQAFDQHIPFGISPEVVMTIINQEIAQYVKSNSEDLGLAALFTNTPGEQKALNVEVDHFRYGSKDNDWVPAIMKFSGLLEENVPSEIMEVMRPGLSTSNFESDATHLISFMDAASKYYQYSMSTMCGIPFFRVDGTAKDWQTIMASVDQLRQLIPALGDYFGNLLPVLGKIRSTVETGKVDERFWSSIYKIDNGSGGPFANGWFNNLYAHQYSQSYKTGKPIVVLKSRTRETNVKLNEFPSNISSVPFNWNYLGNKIPMGLIAGVTAVEMYEGVLTPRLGVAVVEFNPKT